jgi:hypothetical protein
MIKTIKIMLILLFSIKSMAQNDTIKSFSFSGGGNLNIALGDTFLSKGYANRTGYDFEFQFSFRRFFSGIRFEQTFGDIKDKNLIGYFYDSDGFSVNPFVGYRQKMPIPKLYLEHRLGFGYKEIVNYSDYGSYRISGPFVMAGTRVNYKLAANLNVYMGLDFNYTNYQVDLEGPYRDFYRNAYQFTPSLGLKLLFGRKIKM